MTLSFHDVSCEIGGRRILDRLSFDLESGETLILLGRSGSGKTTALRLINALLMPGAGEVLVNGKATTEWDRIALRRKTGYVIQEGGVFPHMTVAANIGLVPKLEQWPADRIASRVQELLVQVGLGPELASRMPRQLSVGQRHRVGLARALAARPPLLLMDESFGALDPVLRLELQDQLIALRKELAPTLVFVTHDLREALRLAGRIALLHEGRLECLTNAAGFQSQTTGEAARLLATL